jgi:hypothetical protein
MPILQIILYRFTPKAALLGPDSLHLVLLHESTLFHTGKVIHASGCCQLSFARIG